MSADDVERVARAIHDDDCDCEEWPCSDGWDRKYHRLARAALAALAARPSADTETLRRVRAVARTLEAEGNGLGGPSDRAYAAAANMLRAALDGGW